MKAAVIGGGPAGLMAAETLARGGVTVTLFDHMPLLGRKLLLAGRGGLNLTHSEGLPAMLARYGDGGAALAPALAAFPPEALTAWCHGLGQATFVGSSGRVFPVGMKASPLLRAWLARLAALGVAVETRRRWVGWDGDGGLRFESGAAVHPDATVLALGGASWPRLGSDGGWVAAMAGLGVAPLRPANCGFAVAWSERFRDRFAGTPLKRIGVTFAGQRLRGEALVRAEGIEGGAIYALSAALREAVAAEGAATLHLDLRPDLDAAELTRRLGSDRGALSLSNFLRKAAGLSPVAVGLVQEALHSGSPAGNLAALVKALPVRVLAPFPLARAISSAGGLRWDELDEQFMLRRRPGVFAAGEMLDWEAPTGGYLLQAAFSTGAAAGRHALAWCRRPRRDAAA